MYRDAFEDNWDRLKTIENWPTMVIVYVGHRQLYQVVFTLVIASFQGLVVLEEVAVVCEQAFSGKFEGAIAGTCSRRSCRHAFSVQDGAIVE